MRFLLVLLALCFSIQYYREWSYGVCCRCKCEQKNLCCALSLWAVDHDGKYPESLEQIRGDYIKKLPTCPASGRAPLYMATPERFTMLCAGEHHAGLTRPNFPAYSSEDGPLGWIYPEGAQPRIPWTLWALFALLIPLSHRRLYPLLLSLLLLRGALSRGR